MPLIFIGSVGGAVEQYKPDLTPPILDKALEVF